MYNPSGLLIREFVEEANKASMRINDYLHVRWPFFWLSVSIINSDQLIEIYQAKNCLLMVTLVSMMFSPPCSILIQTVACMMRWKKLKMRVTCLQKKLKGLLAICAWTLKRAEFILAVVHSILAYTNTTVNHFLQKVRLVIFYFRETRESQWAKHGNFSIVPEVSVVLSTTFFLVVIREGKINLLVIGFLVVIFRFVLYFVLVGLAKIWLLTWVLWMYFQLHAFRNICIGSVSLSIDLHWECRWDHQRRQATWKKRDFE